MYGMSLYFFAFTAGMFLAVQGGFNSQLGVLLRNPFLASFIAYLVSTFFALLYVLNNSNKLPSKEELYDIPFYLWLIGGFLALLV